MKTSLMIIVLLLSFVLTTLTWAEEKPALKLNGDAMLKASEIMKKSKGLTGNPEALKILKRLAEAMKKKQAQK